jgi:hypothetical protein
MRISRTFVAFHFHIKDTKELHVSDINRQDDEF